MTQRFGPFLVDRAGYRVLRDGHPLELTPKLLDLLLYLVEHAGAVVTKEQLLDAVWPDANVTDNALAQAMSELRDALDDDASDPKYIKTIARRGYRFIAAVESIGETVTSRDDGTHAGNQTIAVMDFVNVTDDRQAAWLAAGIAETVTTDLRQLGHFHVVDRWRVTEAVRRTDGALQRVAQDLRARFIVVGSFQCNGADVRITARVVDVTTGEAVADAKVDGPLEAIFSLQDQVVEAFSRELGVVLAPEDGAHTPARETANLDAYRAFSEGWLRIESLDIRELPQAIADFERAVAADPRYTLAYTGLASAELATYENTRSDNEPAVDVLRHAEQHARHAVRLDDTLAEAHATLALVLVSSWQTVEAAAAARRAVSLEPSNWRHLFRLGHASWGEERLRAATHTLALYPDFAFAHFQMAMVHVARGDLRHAEAVLRQGAAVQDRQIARGGRYPALGLHWLLGLVRLAQDDPEEAIAEFEREHALAEPHRLYGREYAMHALYGRGMAQLRRGLHNEATASFQRALELYPEHVPTLLAIALVNGDGTAEAVPYDHNKTTRHVGHRFSGADSYERGVEVLSRTRPIEAAMVKAQMMAANKNADAAVSVLMDMLDTAPPGFAGWTIPVEPMLRDLHGSKGFSGVLARLAERAR